MYHRRRKPGVDRGRAVHGAKWVFVDKDDQFLHYAGLRILCPDPKAWAAYVKQHPDWVLFKSIREAKRWVSLLGRQRAGEIRNLRRQVAIDLLVTNPEGLKVKIGVYTVDFLYEEIVTFDPDTGEVLRAIPIFEETKGYEEELFKWKRKHFEAQTGVALRMS